MNLLLIDIIHYINSKIKRFIRHYPSRHLSIPIIFSKCHFITETDIVPERENLQDLPIENARRLP